MESPAGQWCQSCEVGQGCRIHLSRPEACRSFFCMYTTNRNLGPEWKPSSCKFVIAHEANGTRLSIYPDPDQPEAWRRDPFLKTFHAWAEAGVRHGGQVVIFTGRQVRVVLPDRIVDLGVVAPDELILTAMTRTPTGIRLEPFKAHKDDPRAQALLRQTDRGVT
ncbi:MAG: hypothetical protein JSR60_11390 [Proteobacteria bacterium]|nr:hypothetical protein [Pseudomonadota bacterium]